MVLLHLICYQEVSNSIRSFKLVLVKFCLRYLDSSNDKPEHRNFSKLNAKLHIEATTNDNFGSLPTFRSGGTICFYFPIFHLVSLLGAWYIQLYNFPVLTVERDLLTIPIRGVNNSTCLAAVKQKQDFYVKIKSSDSPQSLRMTIITMFVAGLPSAWVL